MQMLLAVSPANVGVRASLPPTNVNAARRTERAFDKVLF